MYSTLPRSLRETKLVTNVKVFSDKVVTDELGKLIKNSPLKWYYYWISYCQARRTSNAIKSFLDYKVNAIKRKLSKYFRANAFYIKTKYFILVSPNPMINDNFFIET